MMYPSRLVGSWILVLSLLLCLACTGGAPADDPAAPGAGSADRPDVVLITLDTFRPDHLSSYGYGKTTGPFLDSLIAQGTVFRQAHGASTWTAPSTGSLFTGLYPTRHGVTEGFLAHQQRSGAIEDLVGTSIRLNQLPRDRPTLPEVFQRAGYATFGVASNINIGREIGFDRGFDHFRKLQDQDAEKLAAQVVAWADDTEVGKPRFFYLHFNDVHEPYEPRQPWYDEARNNEARGSEPVTDVAQLSKVTPESAEVVGLVAAYDSEISYLDQTIETLYRQMGWDANTLVVLVSDHGEEFGEHGRVGHQFSLHGELMRTLMVFCGADVGIPARDVEVNVSLIDVLPTLADHLGLQSVEGIDGRTLAPWLSPEGPSAEQARRLRQRTLFAHRLRFQVRRGKDPEQMWAAVRGPWKLIQFPQGPPAQQERLYHLEKDPSEKRNRGRFQEGLLDDLGGELETFRAQGIRQAEAQTEVELDSETLESLRSLGYIQ